MPLSFGRVIFSISNIDSKIPSLLIILEVLLFIEPFSKYPFFLYHQDYGNNVHPAERVNNPVEPLHISQLPEVLQAKAKKLHLHFRETPAIQLAEHLDIGAVWTVTYEYKGKYWKQLGSPRGGHLYYCTKYKEFMDSEVMEKAIASGEAVETNWNNY